MSQVLNPIIKPLEKIANKKNNIEIVSSSPHIDNLRHSTPFRKGRKFIDDSNDISELPLFRKSGKKFIDDISEISDFTTITNSQEIENDSSEDFNKTSKFNLQLLH